MSEEYQKRAGIAWTVHPADGEKRTALTWPQLLDAFARYSRAERSQSGSLVVRFDKVALKRALGFEEEPSRCPRCFHDGGGHERWCGRIS